MRKVVMVLALLLAACGSGLADEADAAACDRYAETMQAAQDGEFDNSIEFLAELQRSHELAESERLQDQLGILLDDARNSDMDPATAARINSWCGLD